MANINDFKGVLVYTHSTVKYTLDDVHKFAKNAPNVKDYVILNREYEITGGEMMDQALDVAKLIYQSKPTARIWLGIPTYDSIMKLPFWYNKGYLEVLKSKFLNDSVGKLIWKNCVKGIYINMESIYGDVDYSSSSTLLNNASIKLANDISYFVRNELQLYDEDTSETNLDVLWIPYYGYNSNAATIIKNLGHVISRTNIFDIAIIQPTYYFYYTIDSDGNYESKVETDEQLKTNLNGVKNSLIKDSICYRDGIEVYTRASNATATIGFEMEIDHGTNPDLSRKSKAARYNEYVDTFINYRNKPMCYYAGNKDTLCEKIGKINSFYGNTTDKSTLYF